MYLNRLTCSCSLLMIAASWHAPLAPYIFTLPTTGRYLGSCCLTILLRCWFYNVTHKSGQYEDVGASVPPTLEQLCQEPRPLQSHCHLQYGQHFLPQRHPGTPLLTTYPILYLALLWLLFVKSPFLWSLLIFSWLDLTLTLLALLVHQWFQHVYQASWRV